MRQEILWARATWLTLCGFGRLVERQVATPDARSSADLEASQGLLVQHLADIGVRIERRELDRNSHRERRI